MANISYTKSYLLDKYFSELQKFQEKPGTVELAAFLRQQQQQQSNGSCGGAGVTSTAAEQAAPDKPLPKPPPSPNYVNQQQARTSPPVEDLVHLKGTLITENALLRCLEAVRDTSGHVLCGPQLLLFNTPICSRPHDTHPSSPLPAFTARVLANCTTAPQTVIFSGCCGSGKTYSMLQLLKELFKQAPPPPGGGPDIYRGLQASLTVARAMGSVRSRYRGECSRVGHYVDLQLSSKSITRAKLHLYFLDNSRLTRRSRLQPPHSSDHHSLHSNYRVFYQLLAGLSPEEKRQLHLDRDAGLPFSYLGPREPGEDLHADAVKFTELREALKELGIPFWEVLRLLAAILLLGEPNSLSRIAALLDVRESTLRAGLETRTTSLNGREVINSQCDASYSRWMRDQLAKSLYVRTFGTIIRRANNVGRKPHPAPPPSGTFSASEYSNFSLSGPKEAAMTALNNFIRSTTDNSIGLLDLYGFEGAEGHLGSGGGGGGAKLESLCVNLAAETMQHFYNTHVFKSAMEALRDELDLDFCGGGSVGNEEISPYEDNVPVIDLVSSLRTGLLSILDSLPASASAESYLSQVGAQHAENPRLTVDLTSRSFIISHFAGSVQYDVTDFVSVNRDHLPDDIVAVFHKLNCSFGFASHLFSTELKALGGPEPRGLVFRVSPSSSHTAAVTAMTTSRDLLSTCTEPVSTLTQDFHTRLDNLLRTLVHARPHFVRCFRVDGLRQQMRAFQLLETVEWYVAGLPIKMRLRAFATKFGVGGAAAGVGGMDEVRVCRSFLESKLGQGVDGAPSAGAGWAVGKKHVFLSEPARQALEVDLSQRKVKAATVIQRRWRRWRQERRQRQQQQQISMRKPEPEPQNVPVPPISISPSGNKPAGPAGAAASSAAPGAPPPPPAVPAGVGGGRPAPIAGSPQLEGGLVERTCQMFGLDKDRPPALPQPRAYTVKGGTKFGYPQLRVMRSPFPDLTNPLLQRKELVTVVGISSSKPGHLIVDKNGNHLQVPFQFLEFGCKEGVE